MMKRNKESSMAQRFESEAEKRITAYQQRVLLEDLKALQYPSGQSDLIQARATREPAPEIEAPMPMVASEEKEEETISEGLTEPKKYQEGLSERKEITEKFLEKESAIDFKFIAEREGSSLTGYVPKENNKVLGKSGVTIGTGVDLGQVNVKDLSGLPEELIRKLEPYLGIKGKAADNIAKSLVLNEDEVDALNTFTKIKSTSKLVERYKAATGKDFSSLTAGQQTAVASVSFQYGNLETATPNFWKQIITDDWAGAKRNLKDFGDKYPTRRNKEAALLA